MTRSGSEKRHICELQLSALGSVSTTAFMHQAFILKTRAAHSFDKRYLFVKHTG
jgi:hypothetical protein